MTPQSTNTPIAPSVQTYLDEIENHINILNVDIGIICSVADGLSGTVLEQDEEKEGLRGNCLLDRLAGITARIQRSHVTLEQHRIRISHALNGPGPANAGSGQLLDRE